MNMKTKNLMLKSSGFEITKDVNPAGHTDFLIHRKGEFVRREYSCELAVLFCTRVLLQEEEDTYERIYRRFYTRGGLRKM